MDAWPRLAPVLSNRPIDWPLIERQYDQIVKYATALRLGTAEAEQVLRRFTRATAPSIPPTRRSKSSVGCCVRSSSASTAPARRCAARSTRACRSWRNWNSANTELFYGKDSELTGPDKEHAEVSMLALHLLQSALVHINTLLLQNILEDPAWAERLTPADRRALSPLFWTHVNLYGKFDLDMDRHLDLHVPLVPARA
jgi:TnpA family transposase